MGSFIGLSDSLKELSLDKNIISTLKANTFIELKTLETLNLSNSNVESLEDDCFIGLANLKELYLYGSNVIKYRNAVNNNKDGGYKFLRQHLSASHFRGLDNLRMLQLGYNRVEKMDRNVFECLKCLEKLGLLNNPVLRPGTSLTQNQFKRLYHLSDKVKLV